MIKLHLSAENSSSKIIKSPLNFKGRNTACSFGVQLHMVIQNDLLPGLDLCIFILALLVLEVLFAFNNYAAQNG